VLLGDVLELRHGPAHRALEAARPALAEMAAALGPGGEVVIVPGNHDHQLVGPWLERRAASSATPALELCSEVDWREGELLGALAAALEPARLRAVYPGIWLREDVYATHGHYTDRHNTVPLLERLGAGLVARIVGERGVGPATPDDFEGALAPMYAFIDAVVRRRPPRLEAGNETFQVRSWGRLSASRRPLDLRVAALRGAFALAVAGLNRAGLGPLRAELSGEALREGGLYAARLLAERLAIPARHVVFGHTHRAGPLPGDELDAWRTAHGVRLHNSGSWLLERAFLGWEPGTSPYRPGFCVLVGESGAPRLVNLLDGVAWGGRRGEERAPGEPDRPGLGEPGREAHRVAADPV
jgi:hypothetical protein